MMLMKYGTAIHDIPEERVARALRNGFKLVNDKPEPKIVNIDHDQEEDKGED